MKIPEKVTGKAEIFLDLERGGYMQIYRNDEFGIRVAVTANTRRDDPIRTFTCSALPDQKFDTLEELRTAAEHVDPVPLEPLFPTLKSETP